MKPIAICGFKHAGKTTVASHLAARFGFSWIDLDKQIENLEKQSVSELYQQLGEKGFRRLELSVLKSIDLGVYQIIALGGGTVLNPDSLEFLRLSTQLIYLDTDLQTLEKRILSKKPVWALIDSLHPQKSLEALFLKRQELFLSLNVPTFSQSQMTNLEDYVRKYFR